MRVRATFERRIDAASRRLFAHHATRSRHDEERVVYRGANLTVDFETYVARTYAASWVGAGVGVLLGGATAGLLGALLTGGVAKWLVVRLRGRYLRWVAAARRAGIERTLPGAVQYLRVLATGEEDLRSMLRRVAECDTYGETAAAFRTVIHRAELSGSLDRAIRSVARDTPSDTLAPVLLRLRESATAGQRELASHLRVEARLLGHQQASRRAHREGVSSVLNDLFVVLLAAPAVAVVVVAVATAFSTGLDRVVVTPFGRIPLRTLLLEAGAAGVILVGALSALVVESFQDPATTSKPERPVGIRATFRSATSNPASTAVALAPLGVTVAGIGLLLGLRPVTSGLAGYAIWAVPVGIVAISRTRQMARFDREFRDVVHSLARQLTLGRTLSEAVARTVSDRSPEAIGEPLRTLGGRTRMRTAVGDDGVRTAALNRFADDIGTPLAEEIIELFVGGLNAGSDTEALVEAVETEVDRRYHIERARHRAARSALVIGWTTALLVIIITVAASVHILPALEQLAVVADIGATVGGVSQPSALTEMTTQFYHVAVASALACGWFAGTASGGRYEGLFHSGLLVVVAYIGFWGVGLL